MHSRTQKARTLMRGAVKKPADKAGAAIGHFSGNTHPEREIRAKTTQKHNNIQRFGVPKPPAKPAAAAPISGEVVSRRPAEAAHQTAAPLPSMVASVSHQKLERLLDQALTHADTHKEAMRYQTARHFWQRRGFSGRRRWTALGAALILIILTLLVLWQRVPALSVKAAGLRAHLSPTVPSYSPDGYKMAGPASAVSGTVSIKYSSADNSQSYEIIQAQSNLTSQMVGQNVIPKGASEQTSQVDGNTVYIYGKSNDAAWVNNGVLYTIRDQASLSSDELIKIVEGLNP